MLSDHPAVHPELELASKVWKKANHRAMTILARAITVMPGKAFILVPVNPSKRQSPLFRSRSL